jgi:hypothetical protein
MHYPERWGYLFFSHGLAGTQSLEYSIPESEYAKEYLRQLYYLQKQYWFDHGRYARSLRQLKASPYVWKGKRVPIKFETISQSYIISLESVLDLPRMHIREDGLLWSDGSGNR